MASLEELRSSFRVVWRERGVKQTETFDDRDRAQKFRLLVEACGNRWPDGWIPGYGLQRGDDKAAETFDSYAARTIAVRPGADERTREDYLGMLRIHLSPVIGAKPLASLDRFDVAAVATRMNELGRKPKTIANVHGLLSSVLDEAVTDGLIPTNPAKGALPKFERDDDEGDGEMTFLTKADWALLRKQIPEGTERDLAELLIGTGLRWSEATALRGKDVDLTTGRLSVRRAWKRRGNTWRIGTPKTKRSRRDIGLSPGQLAMLRPYVITAGDAGYLFTNSYGHPMRHNNFHENVWTFAILAASNCHLHREDFIKAELAHRREKRRRRPSRSTPAGRAKLGPLPPAPKPCGCPGTLTKRPRLHDLRHSHCSWLIDAGINIVEIQRRMGHESIQTTIDRYGHLMPGAADSAIGEAIDERLAD